MVCGFFISFNIRINFFHPEFPSCFRLLEADWTLMPETAVNKNNNFLPSKDNIGFTREIVMNTIATDTL